MDGAERDQRATRAAALPWSSKERALVSWPARGKEPRKGSAHPPFWRRAGGELAPGAWPEHSSPPRGTAGGTRLIFPRGSQTEAVRMDAPLRLTLVRIGTKLPAVASDKMEDATNHCHHQHHHHLLLQEPCRRPIWRPPPRRAGAARRPRLRRRCSAGQAAGTQARRPP